MMGKSPTFALGSQELYDWMDNNSPWHPTCRLYKPSCASGGHYNLISINQALEVDLFSQVNAKTLAS